MPHRLDRTKIKTLLQNCDLQTLFIEELGWDHGGENTEIRVADNVYALEAIAQKRGVVAYQYIVGSDDLFPDYPTRQKIERGITKTVREHLIVYVKPSDNTLYWQWVKREPGKSDRTHQHIYCQDQPGEALIQKLEQFVFTLEEEDDLTIVDATERVRAAFDVEKITRKFYDHFKEKHGAFLRFIEGIENVAHREWYASLMLNRMMFIYFIQKRGFLDGDPNYLRNRLQRMQSMHGQDRFQRFYRLFLLRLFHEGLGQPEADRAPDLTALLGQIPYLNGGLFDVHDLERNNTEIHIPDEAFGKIFDFFDEYQWHLDDRPLRKDNEINPDVLGYIFEKYINQKQMGAYYTKEDINGYISRNTVLPFLFGRAIRECAIAFKPDGGVWQLLSDDPDRYIYEAVRHGITYDIDNRKDVKESRHELPDKIAAGLNDVSKRDAWNKPAPEDYALPTETWREHIHRRKHYEEIRAKLANGEVTSINDLITFNLDIEKFALDVIRNSEGPELVRAFWKAATEVSILDPTCGSGAFLFAALNILEPIYTACLETMQRFIDDLERSERKHRPEKMGGFRKVLRNLAKHKSERYFVLKSIIVGNLYGVDIMEEAVEICKLRLFLKLVAQLDNYKQIEPLPDIDFNIRSGNTLIGFTSLSEIQKSFTITAEGQHRVLYAEDKEKLARIEEDAEIVERIFHHFHKIQVDTNMDANALIKEKLELRNRLDNLREELDGYLAGEYGIQTDDVEVYEEWRNSHHPFHWFVEFYGIMNGGGFDVIIGNPPYLETRDVPYSTRHLTCEDCRAIHALCMERSINLSVRHGCVSMIVPLGLVSTQRMTSVQRLLESNRNCWYSNFSWRPGKLFDTVNRALTIFISIAQKDSNHTYSTAYLKWTSDSRRYLISRITYVKCPRNRVSFWVPKLGDQVEQYILNRYISISENMEKFIGQSNNLVFYRKDGGLYWKVFTDFAPRFYINGILSNSSRKVTFSLKNKTHINTAIAILSSDIYWWWYTITSNLRHLNPSDWKNFPVPESAMNDLDLYNLGVTYLTDLQKNSNMLLRNQKQTGRTETQSFKIQKSKPIIDEIDKILAPHYKFTPEELDFIINYDIKYRMGW